MKRIGMKVAAVLFPSFVIMAKCRGREKVAGYLLTACFYFPGSLFALWIVCRE